MTTGADLRDIDRADVYKGNVRAGSLTRSGDNVSVATDHAYTAAPQIPHSSNSVRFQRASGMKKTLNCLYCCIRAH